MYTLYKDKSENFECNINVEGASLSNAKARLILENKEFNLIFEGNINSSGKCVIPIKKLKILSEGLTGKLKLEVIVDEDTYFVPYQDDFKIGVDKKVVVEVLKKNESKIIVEAKPTVSVKPIQTPKKQVSQLNFEDISKYIHKRLKESKINVYTIPQNSKTVNKIISEVFVKYPIKREDLGKIQKLLLNTLSKEL